MKKRLFAFLFCLTLLCIASPFAAAEENEHEGHSTELRELVTGSHTPTDFCGKFYCSDCEEEYYAPVNCEDVGMPIIHIKGSLSGISRENKVKVDIEYSSETLQFTSAATLRIQGYSTSYYPKKNFSVKFYNEDGSKNKLTLVDSWGRHNNYCLKADWIDPSHARNIVSARIYNQIIHSRDTRDRLHGLRRGGAVDGYPVLVYLNGEYYGLYTLTVPKDDWLFNMKGPGKQAILFGKKWTNAVSFYQEIVHADTPELDGWEVEYCSTEDDPEIGTAWAIESINELIRFLRENEGESLRAGLPEYTDVEHAIDVFLFMNFINGRDNRAKNMIWVTFDGSKWYPCMYDMDATWGLDWEGNYQLLEEDMEVFIGARFFNRLGFTYYEEIIERYEELKKGPLSMENITEQFAAFDAAIPDVVRRADEQAWPDMPGIGRDTLQEIIDFAEARREYMDAYFAEIQEQIQSYCG